MTLIDDAATYLAAQSSKLTVLSGTAGNMVKGGLVDAPDTIVALIETGGSPPLHAFSTGGKTTRVAERPSMQVLCRSTSYVVARDYAQIVFGLLDGHAGVMKTGGQWWGVSALQSPFDIGQDRNTRHLVSCNYAAETL